MEWRRGECGWSEVLATRGLRRCGCQLVLHTSTGCDLYLHAVSQPILERCSALKAAKAD